MATESRESDVLRSQLLIATFVPLVGPRAGAESEADAGRAYLRSIWESVLPLLGMSDQWPQASTTQEFPPDERLEGKYGHPFDVICAVADPGESSRYWAFSFVQHDVLGLVVRLLPPEADPIKWEDLEREWADATVKVERPPDALLGEALVRAGVSENRLTAEELARQNLRDCEPTSFATGGGAAAFTVSGRWGADRAGGAGTGADRVDDSSLEAVVLAWSTGSATGSRPPEGVAAEELRKWLAWSSPRHPAPFPSYLLHAAKLRFTEREYESHVRRPLRQLIDHVDAAVKRIEAPTNSRHDASDADADAEYDLHKLHADAADLAQTASVATRNIAAVTTLFQDDPPFEPPRGSLFNDDRELGSWLSEQIESDRAYARAALDRIAIARQRAELALRRKQEKLTLIQTASLGALLAALAAVQALSPGEGNVKRYPVLEWAIIVFLAACFLALPLIWTYFSDPLSRSDQVAWIVAAAGLFWLGAAALLTWRSPSAAKEEMGWLTAVALLPGAAIGLGAAWFFERLRARTPSDR